MSKFISHKPCPHCGSSDAVAHYDDEKPNKCMSCSRLVSNAQLEGVTEVHSGGWDVEKPMDIVDYQHGVHPDRKVSREAAEFFDVRSSVNHDGAVDATYYPYYEDKEIVGYKIRNIPKQFKYKGKTSDELFGQHKFTAGGNQLVIVEGEEDAIAVAHAYLQKYSRVFPVVSLPSATNFKSVIEQREWIRSFDSVTLWLDDDAAGQEAKEKLASIIGFDKIKVTSGNHKDASGTLVNEGHFAVLQAIWNAQDYSPQGILFGKELWKAVESYDSVESVPYPECFTGLNDKLKGMREGEITLWVSGTGAGKSTMLREIALHLLQNTEDKIGIIALEESPAETARKMAGMAINKNPAAIEIPLEELKSGFDSIFDNDRVMVLDHSGAISSGIVNQLEYMAIRGAKYLFIDHITLLVSEGVDGLDANQSIDKVMNDLLRVAKQHKVWIGLVSHLRKMQQSGKSFETGLLPTVDDIRGSGSIKQISNDIVAFARDITNEDEQVRNTIEMRVLKSRYTGQTGPAGSALYNYNTGRLVNPEESWEE